MTAKTPARPRRTTTRSRKTTAAAASDVTVESGIDVSDTGQDAPVDAEPVKKPVRRRRTTKAKAESAPEATDVETSAVIEENAPAEDAVPEEEPKPRRTRKKAVTTSAPRTKRAPRAKKPVIASDAVEEEETPHTPAAEAQPVEATAVEPAQPENVVAEPAVAPVAEAPAEGDTEKKPTFADLELSEPILRAIADMGYTHPTPIQAQAIPAILMARDVLGVAQTGTGKTASFTLPMLEILSDSRARARMPRSLILEPTRELALQVAENFVQYGKYLKLTHALLIGGESMADQKDVLNRGVDVLIATPGRLLDLFERGGLLMTQTRILVIDEADRMLDMGFIPDIEKIVGLLPANRQTLFFSATMAPAIRQLADAFLHAPKEITVSRASSVATTIEAGLVIVDEYSKRDTLRRLLRDPKMQNAIVFCNRKRDVDVLTRSLSKHGFAVGALHGDLPQSVRFTTLEKFKNGELKVLVCSDVAARGIDIGGLSHVFNFDLPFHAEDYVHRIGRTGRAGREGHAYSLATPYDKNLAEAIESLTGKPIPRLAIDGVEQLDWSDEKRPPRNANTRRDKDRQGRDTRTSDTNGGNRTQGRQQPQRDSSAEQQERTPHKPAAPQHDQQPQRNTNAQRPQRDRRNNRDEAPPMPAGDVVGFGTEVPSFMLLPRRTTVLADLPAPTADVSVTEEDAVKLH
ncbi:DEAD/DEAH box helicase [Acetobacter indonesiensis]|nr:DEAD/DEAH box helicase [Acetobacter indonesiensis]MCG0994240.1 DEAD/DEAH box helicase [Acetobacter indonesiensis]